MIPCPTCSCSTRHARRSTVPYRRTAEHIRTCWDYEHDCYAKRMKSKGGRARAGTAYAPATIGGRVIPQIRIAA